MDFVSYPAYKESKKWFYRVFIAIGALIVALVSINVVVDSYGILRKDFSRQFQEPNKNYLKVKYILDNKGKYDSFLFGSSRVIWMNVKKIPGGNYYNMSYSEGLPEEHLNNITFMLQKGVKIRNILVGLDDFSYRVDPRDHAFDLLRQPYPEISGKSWLGFYSEYYMKLKRFIPSLRNYITFNYISGPNHPLKNFYHDIYDSGGAFCKTCDSDIENDPERHRHDIKFKKSNHYEGNHLDQALDSLRDLVHLAKLNGIKLVLFINPIHETTYLDTDLNLLFQFKKRLAELTSYYDFSGLNSITTENYYFYETSHYRPMVADMMFFRMFGKHKVRTPDDFGVLVTKKNVDLLLKKERLKLHNISSDEQEK